ncbi:MAG: YidC/Oxa1 family membrane protein insertase [Acidimicrobiia bacterium]
MFDAIATVLAWFYGLVHSYALAIALLTLTVMILLTPLTLKGTRSMIQMQKLQPEMKKIQAEYKHDRQKMNEELMKFYQEHKINPVGGCLPLLLQTPVFLVLFRVLSGLTETCSEVGIRACTTVGNFAPKYISHDTQLWKDLTSTDKMLSFGLDLSKSASVEIRDNVVHGLPYLILVLIVAATSYIQQWQISVRNKGAGPVPKQQEMLLKVMPVFFAVFSLAFPSGLVVYFLVSNLYRIAQNAYITRSLYAGDNAPAAKVIDVDGEDDAGDPVSKPKPKPKPGSDSTAKNRPQPSRARDAKPAKPVDDGRPAPTKRTTPPRRTPPPPSRRKK